jgi:hypothetical protein
MFRYLIWWTMKSLYDFNSKNVRKFRLGYLIIKVSGPENPQKKMIFFF